MAEFLVRRVDKGDPGDPTQPKEGDVITAQEDGWPWTPKELANPEWVVVKVPGEPLSAYTEDSAAAPAPPDLRATFNVLNTDVPSEAVPTPEGVPTTFRIWYLDIPELQVKLGGTPISTPVVLSAPADVVAFNTSFKQRAPL